MALLSVALVAQACFAWTRPATVRRSAAAPEATLAFSYAARVPVAAARQGTTVTSPDPLLRSVVQVAAVRYDYTGRPGTVRVDAELSGSNGWHTRIPLQSNSRFEGTSFHGRVQLDRAAVSRRVAAAAAETGTPLDHVDVAVVPTIVSDDGHRFVPRLRFVLTPTQLRLAGDDAHLEFRDTSPPNSGAVPANTMTLAGRRVAWLALHGIPAGAGMGAAGVLAFVLFWRRRRTTRESEGPAYRHSAGKAARAGGSSRTAGERLRRSLSERLPVRACESAQVEESVLERD
ncbi:hypothetical protein [Marmoricola sp. RAF53]|uniref:hypothetical protein n=1 Tax=Marmoricola sp. RAF53 TaxID=3233059 RepID=UPI003F9D33AD